MDQNDKNKQTDDSGQTEAKPTAPVPTPPTSGSPSNPPAVSNAPEESQEKADSAGDENVHEYRDVADGVQARVRTAEERAADAPDQDGIEITTANE